MVSIDIDNLNSRYAVTGNISNILSNRRLMFSLRRLSYIDNNPTLYIPFQDKTKVEILQELHSLFQKFSLPFEMTNEVKEEVENYNRELEFFDEFSKNAKNIRNDEFRDNQKLVSEFNNFQSLLKDKLTRILYPLQLLSAFHMAYSQNSCNFAVPGAGKTSIVFAAYTYLKNLPKDDPRHVDNLFVIGPLSSFKSWEDEYTECFGEKIDSQRLSGLKNPQSGIRRGHLYSGNPSEVTLIFHGAVNLLQDAIISFLKRNKSMVVVDEAHRIKNPEGVWGKSIVEISKEAISRVVLTGTPLPNGYQDLYNLFQFLYPYKFKDILGFHYSNLEDMSKNDYLYSDRVNCFIDNISPYFIRIKKSDLNLPPSTEKKIIIKMDEYQREIYDFIETKYISSFNKNDTATVKDILNRAKLIRLRQAASNPSLLTKPIESTLEIDDYYQRSLGNRETVPDLFQSDSLITKKILEYSSSTVPNKFKEIKKILEANILNLGERVIIWTIFIQNAKELRSYLENHNIASKLLIGEVVQEEREDIIDKFNDKNNQQFSVIIANPFSVAESISLHKECHNAIYFEKDYNCSNFLQSKDRIHRYGLPSDQITNYYYLLSENSIDEVIHERLQEKIVRMEKVINDEIPLFSRIDDDDETDILKSLMDNYARRA